MKPEWLNVPVAPLSAHARAAALGRQMLLTKPQGALGRLEQLAVELAALQDTSHPQIESVHVTLFAADHGVAQHGVSAFPQSVTAQMVRNFAQGGAAMSVLARQLNAHLEVINLGTISGTGTVAGVLESRLGAGTADFTCAPAMDEHQYDRALSAGRQAAERAKAAGAQLFIGGEMGIGNTTAATAVACALLNQEPKLLTGPGTGLNDAGIAHKCQVIASGLAKHREYLHDPFQVLRRLGGFEIAALTGAYIACAQMGLPVLIDGFITNVAALVATQLCPNANTWFLFSHASAEPGHRQVLAALNATPLLDLGLRLGEGSGALIALPLLRLACALHNEMATFNEAGVATQN